MCGRDQRGWRACGGAAAGVGGPTADTLRSGESGACPHGTSRSGGGVLSGAGLGVGAGLAEVSQGTEKYVESLTVESSGWNDRITSRRGGHRELSAHVTSNLFHAAAIAMPEVREAPRRGVAVLAAAEKLMGGRADGELA